MSKGVEIKVEASVSGHEDVDKLGKGLDRLGAEANQTGQEAQGGGQALREMGKDAQTAAVAVGKAASELQEMGAAAGRSESRLGATRRGLTSISTQLDEAQKKMGELRDLLIAGFSFNEFVQAAAQMESVSAGLEAVSGGSAAAGEQMDFVRRMANAAGADVAAVGQSFLGLAAATKGTAVEGEPARQVFEAVTLAMAKAGKSSADTQNALLALSQMASKGTVSMEELRGQLGEALPGALQAAASGMGVTTQDLIKLVETGQVAAQDLFPALAKGLNDLYGGASSAQTLSQEITNIKNAFVDMASSVGESGGLDALKIGAEAAQTAIFYLGDTLIQVGQYIGTLAAAAANVDFSGISAAFAEIEAQSRERLLRAAEHNEVLRSSVNALGTDAQRAALAQQQQAAAASQVAAQSDAAAPSVAALGVAYQKVRTEIEAQVGLAAKEIEAVKARGAAAVAMASGLGDEQAKREAVAQAAQAEALAMSDLALKRENEVQILKAELDARIALLGGVAATDEARKKEIDGLKALIATKEIEANTTRAQAQASEEKARANSLEVQASAAATDAARALAVARTTDAKVMLSGLEAQRELARQTEQMARLMGNEEAARTAKIAQLRIEAQMILAKANVQKAEAEGSIAVAQATLAELRAKGQLTQVKEAEINAAIRLAQAKINEAKATEGSAKLLERQIALLREGASATNEAGRAANAAASGYNNMAAAALNAAQAANAAREAANRDKYGSPLGPDKYSGPKYQPMKRDDEGYSVDDKGQHIAVGSDIATQLGLANFLKSAGLDEARIAEMVQRFSLPGGDVDLNAITKAFGKMGTAGVTPYSVDNAQSALVREVGRLLYGEGGGRTAPAARTVNVNLNVGGQSTPVQVASEADAQSLIEVLRRAGLNS